MKLSMRALSFLFISTLTLFSVVQCSSPGGSGSGGSGSNTPGQSSSSGSGSGGTSTIPDATVSIPRWASFVGSGTAVEAAPYTYTQTTANLPRGVGQRVAVTLPPADQCLPDILAVEEIPGPMSYGVRAEDFTGNVIFISGSAPDGGDGSRTTPFRRISDAVAAVRTRGAPAALLVHGGEYREDLTLPAGVYLFGSFNDEWRQNITSSPSRIINQNNSLTIGPSERGRFNIINGFFLYGAVRTTPGDQSYPTVSVSSGGRLVMSHNTVFMGLAPVTWTTYGDTHYGQAVSADSGSVMLFQNRFRPLDRSMAFHSGIDPDHLISIGVWINGGCVDAFNNDFLGWRWGMNTRRTTGRTVQNTFEAGYGFIETAFEGRLFQGNIFGTQSTGATFYFYVGPSGTPSDSDPVTQPRITENRFLLYPSHVAPLNEVYAGGDPQALTRNEFLIMPGYVGDAALYGDYDTLPHDPGMINRKITSLAEVNALRDIPTNGENTVRDLRR